MECLLHEMYVKYTCDNRVFKRMLVLIYYIMDADAKANCSRDKRNFDHSDEVIRETNDNK